MLKWGGSGVVVVGVALACFAASPGRAQPAHLVKDIRTEGGDEDYSPADALVGLRSIGGHLFFDGAEGRDLWVSDGTPAGTEVLHSVCSGSCRPPEYLAELGPVRLWFRREDFGHPQLWRSDGTQTGTYPLSGPDVTIDSEPFYGRPMAKLGRVFYFVGCGRDSGGFDCDLWRTDGTLAGTRRLHTAPRSFGWLQPVGNRLYYLAGNGLSWDLWVTDGSDSGIKRVRGFSGLFARPEGRHAAVGNRVVFSAAGDSSGEELWTSDGTAEGTRAITAFVPAEPFESAIPELLSAGGRVYFTADDGVHGEELWRSDGTPAGTVRLTDFASPSALASLFPSGHTVLGESLIFVVQEEDGSTRLWVSRGSPATTAPLPLNCAGCTLDERSLIEAGGKAFFLLERDSHWELWVTDGTAAGSRRATSLCAGGTCDFAFLQSWKGRLVFLADSDLESRVWSTDGSPGGTKLFADLKGHWDSSGSLEVAELAGTTYFLASLNRQTGLWAVEAGGRTRPILTLSLQVPSAFPALLGGVGSRLLFHVVGDDISDPTFWLSGGDEATTFPLDTDDRQLAFDSRAVADGGLLYFQTGFFVNDPIDLWRSDGTAPGTFVIARLQRTAVLAPGQGGLTYFEGRSIWKTDGTVAGTVKTGDYPVELERVEEAFAGPNGLYLKGSNGNGAKQVWITDGTTAGTRQLTSATQDRIFGWDPKPATVGGAVYFAWTDGLWKSDGTAAGTFKVQSLPNFELPVGLATLDGKLVYLTSSANPAVGVHLRSTDGTLAGTVQLAAFPNQTITLSNPVRLVPFAGKLYFAGDDGVHGSELWSTDGTPGGTAQVLDLVPGPGSFRPSQWVEAGGKLYFAAEDPRHGRELWQTDGTPAGTRLVHDVAPQALSSIPSQLTVAGDNLYFTADDGVTGRELWVLPLGQPDPCRPSATRLCLQGGRYAVEAAWTDPAGNHGVGQAVPLTADTGWFWFFDPSNVEAVLKVLDGAGVNGHTWVFYGALSNVEYTLTVTDTQTGLAHRYRNPQGELASVGDTEAFGPQGASLASVTTVTRGPAAGSALALASRKVVPRAATGVCAPSSTRLCLNGGRYAVEAAWKDFAGNTGVGQANGLTADTGWFWFFDPANVELVLKVLDGTPVNGHRWVFYGALSSVEYTVTVTDTQTGEVRTYRNPSGQLASVADTAAF